MTREEELREAIKGLARGQVQTFPATVKEVSQEDQTVTVEPLDGPELFEVRLKAAIDGQADGFLIWPAVGSQVLVGLIGNDPDTCFVVKYGAVEKVEIKNGGNGGVPKAGAIVERLNVLEQDLNALKEVFKTTWVVAPSDGGLALKTAAAVWANQEIEETEQAAISNEDFKH